MNPLDLVRENPCEYGMVVCSCGHDVIDHDEYGCIWASCYGTCPLTNDDEDMNVEH